MTLNTNQISNSNINTNVNFCKNYNRIKRRPLLGHALDRDFMPKLQKKKTGLIYEIKALFVAAKNFIKTI